METRILFAYREKFYRIITFYDSKANCFVGACPMKKLVNHLHKPKSKTIFALAIAKIAQLVEHNLAKVGVAGSSPVVRSMLTLGPGNRPLLYGDVAKW